MLHWEDRSFRDHGISEWQSYITHHYLTTNRTAKVWVNFQLTYDLKGHEQAVWAVKAVDEEHFLTGKFSCPAE
jgi:hypothetical protein